MKDIFPSISTILLCCNALPTIYATAPVFLSLADGVKTAFKCFDQKTFSYTIDTWTFCIIFLMKLFLEKLESA